ncbi:PACE efflux transporter [uncultured Ferrimonas sp.]|uniref:PACE efflux transporter n=1 Tax=uncultured Ferrimonas sp. TaxID=432640 RepID=UPI002620F90D|nr:PACE efflux transporter [uncultured Ferrimonas sp.]
MNKKERIVHSVLFEVLALLMLIPLGAVMGGIDGSTMTGIAVAMSVIAMVVNYGYNLAFDKAFGDNRIERSLWLRIGHGIGFETVLLGASLPLLMWATGLDFWTVLLLDLGMVVFFLLYAIAFNYLYDIARHRLVTAASAPCQ